VAVEVRGRGGRGDDAIDAVLHYAGQHLRVLVEFQATGECRDGVAARRVRQGDAGGPRVLLIADETTADAREVLEEAGVGVVDGLGNAHMEFPGLLLHIEGRGRPRNAPTTRLRGKSGVAAQALLLAPERTWQVTDLARAAQISNSLAHRVLARLDGEGITTAERSGPERVRRVTNPAALLDLWTEESAERPVRTSGYLLAQTPRQLLQRLGENLEGGRIDYAMTGSGAASIVAPFITAVPVVEVWAEVTAAPDDLASAAQMERVTDGPNVAFLQLKDDGPLAFREKADDLWLVNRFRLYPDLRRDPRRGREQADRLREEVIGF
jgi:hypothetical protein